MTTQTPFAAIDHVEVSQIVEQARRDRAAYLAAGVRHIATRLRSLPSIKTTPQNATS
jgi:hypothetical protein